MLIKKPIIINSFARGGSNIIWEILQSHPQANACVGETDKIIWEESKNPSLKNIELTLKGGYLLPSIEKSDGYWMKNYGVFHAGNYKERKLNEASLTFLDDLWHRWKLKTLDHKYNKYKTETEVYTKEEVIASRLVAKHVNGVAYLTPALMEAYPDSIHFGLIRNGLALCESRLRRKTFDSAGKFGMIFNKMVDTFEKYDKEYDNFHLIRFEDLLKNPKGFIKEITEKVNLPYDPNRKVRLKAKKFVKASGEHSTAYEENSKYWISQDELLDFVNPNINETQIKKLSDADKKEFLSVAGDTMKRLGYL